MQEEQRRRRLAEVDANHRIKHEVEEDGSDSDGGLPLPRTTCIAHKAAVQQELEHLLALHCHAALSAVLAWRRDGTTPDS